VKGLAVAVRTACAAAPEASGLHAVTLTVPEGGSIRESAAKFAAAIESKGGSVLLLWDVGAHEKAHVHGFVLAPDGQDFVGDWLALTDGRRVAQRRRRVTGWDRYLETGDDRLLAQNIEQVLTYGTKAPAVGERDLERDVWSSGILRAAWEVFMVGGTVTPPPTAIVAPASEKPSPYASPGRTCAGCRGPMPLGKRSHAAHHGGACRTRAWRRRRAEGRAS
jgi:hypothetical protein